MRILFVLIISVLCIGCSSKYEKYTKIPAYITNASALDKAYFKAYDETLKLWDVAFEDLYIPTTHGVAHVIVSGPENGEPVVLLHGMNASSTMWYPNIKALSSTHRVYAIDFLLEAGKSQVYSDMENVDAVIDWYQEILFVLELDSFHLIGASRGGWLAVNLALDNQKSVKSMILLSPAQTFTWIKPSMNLLKNVAALLSSKEKRIAQSLESMSSNVANISDAYLEQYYIATEKDSENQFMSSMQPFSNDVLKSLQMPVLVLIGDDDMINERRTIEIAKMLPQGKGEIIHNAGHFLSIDQAEVVNAKMLGFLKK